MVDDADALADGMYMHYDSSVECVELQVQWPPQIGSAAYAWYLGMCLSWATLPRGVYPALYCTASARTSPTTQMYC
jgi:hypothetical protein